MHRHLQRLLWAAKSPGRAARKRTASKSSRTTVSTGTAAAAALSAVATRAAVHAARAARAARASSRTTARVATPAARHARPHPIGALRLWQCHDPGLVHRRWCAHARSPSRAAGPAVARAA